MLYAQEFPVRGLRCIFLLRWCVDYLYNNGARRVFLDCWEDFVNHISIAERGDLMKAYYERLIGDDELERMAAAKSWSAWRKGCSKLRPDLQALGSFTKPHNAIALARLEVHYI